MPTLEQATQVFEDIYQGADGEHGLCELETLPIAKGLLGELHRRLHWAWRSSLVAHANTATSSSLRPGSCCRVYTHRSPAHAPRSRVGSLKDIFKMQICVENCSPKPSPKPVQLALQALGADAKHDAMAGDTVDDVVAGASADAQVFGVLKPRACRSTDPLAREHRHLQPRTQCGEPRARVVDGRQPHVRDSHALRTSSSRSRAPRAARLTLKIDVLRGHNGHHRAEASFKAPAVALRSVAKRDASTGTPSTVHART